MAVFGKKKKTVEDVAAELKKPIWWVGWAFAISVPNEIRTKTNITKIFGEEVNEQAFDTIYSESKSPLHEQKAIYEKTPTLVAHELAREIIPYLIVKKTGNKYTKKIGRAVMIAIENSLKRGEETPEAMDEERFAKDVVDHLSKHFIVKDPEKTKKDLVKVIRAIKEYSSTILSIDPIKEEPTVKAAYTHMEADPNELESSDSYLEQSAPEVFEKWWQLKTTIAEVLGTKPYRHEVKPPQKRGRKTTRKNATKKEQAPAKIITKTEPSVEEKALQALKSMGIDVKLETGNVAERKAKIFAWLEREGLVEVKEENGKPVVVPTEEFHRMISRVGLKAAAAMIKWAAEENVSREHVEPVAKAISALEELRQIAKREDPETAKALEKAMKSKHTVRELYLLMQGVHTPEELSERWSKNFGRVDLIRMFEKYPELAKATLQAMEEMEKKGLAEPPVPRYWAHLLKDIREGRVDREKLEEYLALATHGKHVFISFHSIAGGKLPESGAEIEKNINKILQGSRNQTEIVLEQLGVTGEAKRRGLEYLERNIEQLAQIIAYMKDPNHLDEVEKKVAPILEKLPKEGRKVGLFRREPSPREKVEEFAKDVIKTIKAGADEKRLQELFQQAEQLKEELRKHVGEGEADRLVRMLTAPAVAEMWKRRLGPNAAEEYVKVVAQDNVHRFLGLEPKLIELKNRMSERNAETLELPREEAMRIHDDLVRHLTTWEMPGTMAMKEPFVRRERTKNMLKAIVERHYR